MELTEKEKQALTKLARLKGDITDEVLYFKTYMTFLERPEYINLRSSCRNLNEFKRKMLGVRTDEEVENIKRHWLDYCKVHGYLEYYNVKMENK